MKKRKDISAVTVATFYLFIYAILLQFDATRIYAVLMLGCSPLVVLWMVYTVLKHGRYNGPGLGNDEFGYQDRDKNTLGPF